MITQGRRLGRHCLVLSGLGQSLNDYVLYADLLEMKLQLLPIPNVDLFISFSKLKTQLQTLFTDTLCLIVLDLFLHRTLSI